MGQHGLKTLTGVQGTSGVAAPSGLLGRTQPGGLPQLPCPAAAAAAAAAVAPVRTCSEAAESEGALQGQPGSCADAIALREHNLGTFAVDMDKCAGGVVEV